jgi:glucose-6-phosphate 1-dehydrogenase
MGMQSTSKPFTLILFGATGDLAVQKLFPALFALHKSGGLAGCSGIIAVSRRHWQDGDFRDFLSVQGGGSYNPEFMRLIRYARVDVDANEGYKELAALIKGEPIVYLSLAPQHHRNAISDLQRTEIISRGKGKLLIEKPFGVSERTAKSLNKLIGEFLDEDQIYRVDHYLGKSTLRAAMKLHQIAPGLETLLDKDHLHSIRVRFFESTGIQGRGASYDGVGAFRDVGQNHMLEMLAVLAASGKHREGRTAILESLAPASKTCGLLRRGQHISYKKEPKVDPQSDTETAFEAMVLPTHGQLEGVQVTLEGGKYMPMSEVFTEAVFKNFSDLPRALIFSVRPKEEIILIGRDGSRETFAISDGREAYENVIADALLGRMDFFAGKEEIEALWRYADQVLACFKQIPLETYDNERPF